MSKTEKRQEIIFKMSNCGDAEASRICYRLQQCNTRILRSDGSYDESDVAKNIRGPRQLASAMQDDDTIVHLEYCFNQKWSVAE